jgi:hypothetical protein
VASGSGEIHRETFEIDERAVAEGSFVSGTQNHARRLARLQCFLPAGAQRHQRSPALKPGKPNSGLGVERSLPRDFENCRNAAVMTAQTV